MEEHKLPLSAAFCGGGGHALLRGRGQSLRRQVVAPHSACAEGHVGAGALRAWSAIELGGSGLVKAPLRVLLGGRRRADSLRRRSVLLLTGTYGLRTTVWIHRHATELKRYRTHVASFSYRNRTLFPHPSVHLVDHPGRLTHRLLQAEYALRTLRWPRTEKLRAWRLEKIVRSTGADLIHAHFLWNAPLAARVAETCGVPLLVTAHGSDVNRAKVNVPYRQSLQPAFAAAAHVIAVSDFIAGKLAEIRCPPDKIQKIHIGAPVPPAPAEVGRRDDGVRVICVAALLPVKGHRYLLEAFARAACREPRLSLTLVGDGELRRDLESQIEHLDIRDRVDMVGWASPDKVQGLLARSHVYAQHSVTVRHDLPGVGVSMKEEGLPVSMVEAAALGLPIVASRTGGVPEICRDGENGYLVDKGDEEAMAERLVELARDPELRARLGGEGRRLAEEEFDLSKQLAKIEDLYDELRSGDAGIA